MRLYKGKYLIAVYDEDGYIVDCATRVRDLHTIKKGTCLKQISRGTSDKHTKQYTVYLIDCLEKQDDIFKEEDEIFLEEEKQLYDTKMDIYKEVARRNKMSLRTLFR